MAGYLFSNTKLREELSRAKDAEAAARLLGRHLQRDGKRLAHQVKDFVQSEEVQENFRKMKHFAGQKTAEATKELQRLIGQEGKAATRSATKAVRDAQKAAKATARRVRARTRTLL